MNQVENHFAQLGLEHESALAEYVAEFEVEGESRIHGYFGKPEWSHAETVENLMAWSRGERLSGFVPSSTRFLVVNQRIVGNYNFRHLLSPELERCGGHCGYSVRPSERRKGYGTLLLKDAKRFARGLGLDRILLTCSSENIGSSRVIERNGGRLHDQVHDQTSDATVNRYWIELSVG
ncbi:MAG: GNAT family N-acetyltransferase [Rhodopirellula sp. JB055]|uniref:GNAT family N-acetyltransferase n=1 Tax=Rhodopirellula sp. JB055 TaxID=3342846 RepID=UPI00370B7477